MNNVKYLFSCSSLHNSLEHFLDTGHSSLAVSIYKSDHMKQMFTKIPYSRQQQRIHMLVGWLVLEVEYLYSAYSKV